MRSIFDAYDEEFTAVTGEISRQISHVRAYEEDDRTRQNILRSLDGQLGQALDLMKQMEVEVRSTENPHEKCTLHDRVLLYKKTMLSLRGDFQEVLELEQKRGLMQGAGNRSPPSSLNQFQQARMEQTGQQLDEQSRMLEDGKGMVFEMEEVANDITQELGRNRETIKSAHRKVLEAKSLTASARRLLHYMSKREFQQKAVLAGIILLLLSIVAVVIYARHR